MNQQAFERDDKGLKDAVTGLNDYIQTLLASGVQPEAMVSTLAVAINNMIPLCRIPDSMQRLLVIEQISGDGVKRLLEGTSQERKG